MTINKDLYGAPARRGDVSGIAIDLGLALTALSSALKKVQSSVAVDLSREIKTVDDAEASISRQFDALIGWEDNAA